MELLFSSSILLTSLLFVFMALKMVGNRFKATNKRSQKLPPGPWKLPIIGNMHQFVGSLPHHVLTNLAKKYGPLMHLQMGEITTIVVSSPEFAKHVLKSADDQHFTSRIETLATKVLTYDFKGVIFTPCSDQWKELRKICVLELLSMKRVESFRSTREQEVSDLVNWIASKSGSVINLTDKFCSLIYRFTSKAAIGNKSKDDQEILITIVNEFMKVAMGTNIADLFPSIKFLQWMNGMKFRVEKLHQKADTIISNIIDEHKKKCKSSADETEEDEDLLGVLLRVQQNHNLQIPITNETIKTVIFEIFVGGIETSSITLSWAFSEMMKNPRVMKKAQAEVREVLNNRKGKIDELQFLKLVIKETLRLHPPSPLLFPRECGESCKINGFDIPKKATVIVNAWAMGRDPQYWNEPESFIPERFLDCSTDFKGTSFEYIPFSAGRRMCPGISFAIANIEHSLAMLLYHFDWSLPDGMNHQDLDMTESFGTGVGRKHDLCVVPTLYCRPQPPAAA